MSDVLTEEQIDALALDAAGSDPRKRDLAYRALLDHYGGLIRYMGRQYVPRADYGDVLSLASEALVVAVQQYDPADGHFKPYLAALLEYHLVALYMANEAKKRKPPPGVKVFSLDAAVPTGTEWRGRGDKHSLLNRVPDPRDTFAPMRHRDQINELWRWVKGHLTPLERRSYLLVYGCDWTFQRAAARLGVSYKVIDNALCRAREKLSRQLRAEVHRRSLGSRPQFGFDDPGVG